MDIGVKEKLLQEMRIKAGFTQRSLARRAGVSHSYLSQIEGGKRKPGPEFASAICRALGVKFDDIFFIISGCKSDQEAVLLDETGTE